MKCRFKNCRIHKPIGFFLTKQPQCNTCTRKIKLLKEAMKKVICRVPLITDPEIFRTRVSKLLTNTIRALGEEQYQYALKLMRPFHIEQGRKEIIRLRAEYSISNLLAGIIEEFEQRFIELETRH